MVWDLRRQWDGVAKTMGSLFRLSAYQLCDLGQNLCLDSILADKTLPGVTIKIKQDHAYKLPAI